MTEAMAPDGNSHEFNDPLGVKADGVKGLFELERGALRLVS
jgi:hypothetical protein